MSWLITIVLLFMFACFHILGGVTCLACRRFWLKQRLETVDIGIALAFGCIAGPVCLVGCIADKLLQRVLDFVNKGLDE